MVCLTEATISFGNPKGFCLFSSAFQLRGVQWQVNAWTGSSLSLGRSHLLNSSATAGNSIVRLGKREPIVIIHSCLAYFPYFESIEETYEICVCVFVYPSTVYSQRLGKIPLPLLGNGSVKISLSLIGNGSLKRYSGKEYTRNNRRIVGRVVF
jgi:hypothetical protein